MTKAVAEIELTDDVIDDLIRTSGNYLYSFHGTYPIHEDDVENCLNP